MYESLSLAARSLIGTYCVLKQVILVICLLLQNRCCNGSSMVPGDNLHIIN